MMCINKWVWLNIHREYYWTNDNKELNLANKDLKIIKSITAPDQDELCRWRRYYHYTYWGFRDTSQPLRWLTTFSQFDTNRQDRRIMNLRKIRNLQYQKCWCATYVTCMILCYVNLFPTCSQMHEFSFIGIEARYQ